MNAYESNRSTPPRESSKPYPLIVLATVVGLALAGLLAGLGFRAFLTLRSTCPIRPEPTAPATTVEIEELPDRSPTDTLEGWRLNLQADIEASEKQELETLPGFVELNEKPFWGPHSLAFSRNSTSLEEGSVAQLAALSQTLKAHPELKVWVVGYADSSEASQAVVYEEGLKQLSLQRAEGVAQWLKADGIEANRIQTRGEGSAFPIDLNRAIDSVDNRRVMLLLLPSEVSKQLSSPPSIPLLDPNSASTQ